jgi:phage N-6-adenine-methyltransferase
MAFSDSQRAEGRHVEWATPTTTKHELIAEFGAFDLDVATMPHNPMDAARFFTESEDGLKQTWTGQNVYMNPPYGRVITQWVQYAIDQYEAGHAKQIVMLLPSRTDTKWFHLLYDHPHAELRFYRGRLRFNDAKPAPMPSVLIVLRSPDETVENK